MPCRTFAALFHGKQNIVSFNSCFDDLPFAEVFLCVIERSKDHVLHLLIGEAVGWLHLDLRLFAAALLTRAHVQNAIGIDEEPHLNARHARRHRGNAFEIEAGERTAIIS